MMILIYQEYKMSEYNESRIANVSAWKRKSKAGNPYISGLVQFYDGHEVKFTLFPNTDKKSEKQPDLRGNLSADNGLENEHILVTFKAPEYKKNKESVAEKEDVLDI